MWCSSPARTREPDSEPQPSCPCFPRLEEIKNHTLLFSSASQAFFFFYRWPRAASSERQAQFLESPARLRQTSPEILRSSLKIKTLPQQRKVAA